MKAIMEQSFTNPKQITISYEGDRDNGDTDVRCGCCYERFPLKWKPASDPTFLDPTYCPHCKTEVFYPGWCEW